MPGAGAAKAAVAAAAAVEGMRVRRLMVARRIAGVMLVAMAALAIMAAAATVSQAFVNSLHHQKHRAKNTKTEPKHHSGLRSLIMEEFRWAVWLFFLRISDVIFESRFGYFWN